MALRDLVVDSLTLNLQLDPERIIVRWLGKAGMRNPSTALAPFFRDLITVAEESGRFVEFHFQEMEHFNSSTILSIMQIIQTLRRKQLKLRIVFNAQLKWQKMTFEALRQFDAGDGLFEMSSDGS